MTPTDDQEAVAADKTRNPYEIWLIVEGDGGGVLYDIVIADSVEDAKRAVEERYAGRIYTTLLGPQQIKETK